jgi:RNA polymerase sigma-70 factor (ECF subfamily)
MGVRGHEGADTPFAAFYRRYFSDTAGAVRSIVRDDAEDVAQDAFLKLRENWDSVAGYDLPQAWVRRVAIRLALRRAERDRLRAVLDQEMRPAAVSHTFDPDLRRALDELPAHQRAAILLHHLEGRPVAELSDLFGCSEEVMKAWLHRARNRLAERLSGLDCSWVAETAFSVDDVAGLLRARGWHRFTDPVIENLPIGRSRWMISLRNGRFRLRNDAGEPLDRGAFRVIGDRLVLRSKGYPGSVEHRLRLHDNRLVLQQLQNRNPVVYGVPDEIFQHIFFGVTPFERVEARTRPARAS